MTRRAPIFKDPVLTDAIKAFEANFEKSPAWASDGHAQRPLKREAARQIEVGVARGHETTTCEVGHFSVLRLTFQGMRSLVRLPVPEVLALLDSLGESESTVTPQRLYQFVKSINNDMLAKLAEAGGKIWFGTVGPADCLFMPPGWVFAERPMRNQDVLGIREAFMRGAGQAMYERASAWLKTAKRPSDMLQKAIDTLLLKL